MTEDNLRTALDTAPDDDALCVAIRRGGDSLRQEGDTDQVGLAALLAPLASHPSEKVRKAVGDACDLFPAPFFDRVLVLLAADLDHYVRAAAVRAGQRRALRRKAALKAESEERVLLDLLGEIERKHGKASRKLAERAVRRGVEQVVGRLNDELSRMNQPGAALREQIDFVQAIIRRGREYAGDVKAAFTDEQLASVLDEARAQLLDRVGDDVARTIAFTADVSPDLRLHADRPALLRVFENLLQNAVESYDVTASRAVRVEARALRNGSEIGIRVVDEGAGMTDEVKARLFVPFATAKARGAGVGLAIVRKLVEDLHSGEVSVASTRGKGTAVTLVFPAQQGGVRP
jgi:signal transduction histidine kinase